MSDIVPFEMTTTEANKILANFHGGWEFRVDDKGQEWAKRDGEEMRVERMMYDESWDWLISVWSKFISTVPFKQPYRVMYSTFKECIDRNSIEEAFYILVSAVHHYDIECNNKA